MVIVVVANVAGKTHGYPTMPVCAGQEDRPAQF
jgi:hypothetical protein